MNSQKKAEEKKSFVKKGRKMGKTIRNYLKEVYALNEEANKIKSQSARRAKI